MKQKNQPGKTSLGQIARKLEASPRILLATHYDPDGDCLGSTLALALALKKLDKKIALACADQVPPHYRFLPQPRLWQTKVSGADKHTLAVVVDCANPRRLGRLRSAVMGSPLVINIDHHGDNTNFGQLNYAPAAAAVGLHIYRLIKNLGASIDAEIATALYVALLTDTGGFRFSNTDSEVLTVASELVRKGAEPGRIAGLVYENFPASQVRMAGLIYQRLKTLAGGRIAFSWLDHRDLARLKVAQGDLGTPVDYLRILGGVEIVLFFRETKGGLVKVNFRSKGRANVRRLAQPWGGGGHRSAAGATIKGKLAKIRPQVLRQAGKIFHY